MNKHTFSTLLVVCFAFVASIQAEYITQEASFTRNSQTNTQTANLSFDLSGYDLSMVNDLSLDLSAMMNTWAFINAGSTLTSEGYDVNAGEYFADIYFRLNVSVNSTMIANNEKKSFDNTLYWLSESTHFSNSGDEANTEKNVIPLVWFSTDDLMSLLGDDQILNIDFSISGPFGNVIAPPLGAGIASGIEAEAIVNAQIRLSIDTENPVTPEPATMLIFGTALMGLPLVRRFQRKQSKAK